MDLAGVRTWRLCRPRHDPRNDACFTAVFFRPDSFEATDQRPLLSCHMRFFNRLTSL